jgi:hypothetical protein
MPSLDIGGMVCQTQHAWDDAHPHDIRDSPSVAYITGARVYTSTEPTWLVLMRYTRCDIRIRFEVLASWCWSG